MTDYEAVLKQARTCANRKYCDIGGNCEYYDLDVCCQGGEKDILKDAADAIEELLAAVPKWISVEERLPEDQGDDARAARGGDYIHKVLAASVTPNYTVMDTAYLENGIWSLSQYTSWKQIIGAPVTHWMPLPEPPKEDAE